MIEIKNLSKRYLLGEVYVTALDSINLTIQRGEFVAIMGSSGSGKSTLLNILGTLDKPTTGEYLIEGRSIHSLPDVALSKLRNHSFGFVFQAYHLFPELKAWENVAFPLRYSQVPKKEHKERAIAQLEKVGLGKRLDHFPRQLSGGEQQRVAIARAMINEPSVLFADEPTGNLSKEMGEDILKLFEDIHARGATLVLVTHDPDVGKRASRLIRVQDGHLVQS